MRVVSCLLFLFSLLFVGCGDESNQTDKPASSDFFQEPVRIRYANEIDGYKVEVLWIPTLADESYLLTGPAVIKLTNANGETGTVVNNFFGFRGYKADEITAKLGIDHNDTGDIIGYKKNELILEYSSDTYFEPFFFGDINFDGKLDFIAVEPDEGQRSRDAYKVHELKDLGGSGFGGGFNAITYKQPFVDLDEGTGIDSERKTITHSYSGGAYDFDTVTYTLKSHNLFTKETESFFSKGFNESFQLGKSNTRWNEYGEKRWEIIYTFDNGDQEDLLITTASSWLPDGSKCPLTNIKDGNGIVVLYYDDGKKMSQDKYKEGKLVSAARWLPDGSKCPITNLKDGNGVIAKYGHNGKKYYETNYKDSKEQGHLSICYYDSGQKMSETNYKDGEWHGLETWWHKNGQKKFETNYMKGERHGLLAEWDSEGNVTSQSKWENGKRVEEIK
jgi:antitoxin component YwqK of YwqJK toxin-antitoxin module